MTAVTENQLIRREDGCKGGGPVGADEILYTGTLAFVGTDGFYTATAENKFGGVVIDADIDNTGGLDGAIDVNVYEEGSFTLPGAGFTQADVGKAAHAADNYTINVAATGVKVGTITRVFSATEVLVAIDVQV